MRTLFFGTPSLAVPFLELLAGQTELKGIVTTPDEPAGRGYELQATPVKQAALHLNLPVLQPATLKDPGFIAQLQAFNPELAIVVAYGKILPSAVLKVPQHGFLNVHFSLLPAYRGAAPIQHALMNGEKQTGVTLFWLDEGMDTGPIFLQKSLVVTEEDDAESLREKLVPLGLGSLKEALAQLSKGQMVRTPQTGTASLAHSLKKDEGKIDWSQPARILSNLVRGTTPWPGAFTFVLVGGKTHRLKVLKAKVLPEYSGAGVPSEAGGVVGLENGVGFVVKCSQEFLQVLQVQPEGKRPMSAWDYWQGARLKIGDKLG
jgi:methionyl-tRNA formyltransferase